MRIPIDPRFAPLQRRCALSPHREYRHLLLKLGQSSLAREARGPLVRESWDSFIVGALSLSFGVAVLIALVTGRVGLPTPGSMEPTIAENGRPLIQTHFYGITAMIGEFLGLAGILLARSRHGAISPLSLLGTIICLSHFVVFFYKCG